MLVDESVHNCRAWGTTGTVRGPSKWATTAVGSRYQNTDEDRDRNRDQQSLV
jgi:hypothetical protein